MITRRSLVILSLAAASLLIVGAAVAAVGNPASSTSSASSTSPTSTTGVTSTTITTTTPGGSIGEATEYAVAESGFVVVEFDGTSLTLADVSANDGWIARVERSSGLEVEVKFLKGNRRVDFEAEIEDGAVKTRVRERILNDAPGGNDDAGTSTTTTAGAAVADGPLEIDATPAGSVVVQIDGGSLSLLAIDAVEGWTTSYEIEANEIKVEFHDGTTEVEVEVELEGGELEVEVTVEREDSTPGSDDDSDRRGSSDHDDDDDDTHDEDEDDDHDEDDDDEDDDD